MCVFVSACVCVSVFVLSLVLFLPLWRGERGGVDCFQFDIKVQDIAKCRSGLSEHFSKVRKFFPSLSLLLFFFFFASPHNVTPSTIKCTFVCVCVCLWFIYVYFWGLATKCQAKKLRAQNFSFVVVLSTVGDLSNCFSFSRLVLHLFNNLNRLCKLLFQGLKQSMVHCQMGAIREWEWERDGVQANRSATLSMAWRAYRKEVLHKCFADS